MSTSRKHSVRMQRLTDLLYCCALSIFMLAIVLGPQPAHASWTVKRLANGAAELCVMESNPVPLFDGYVNTTAVIRIDDTSVSIESPSELDPSFDDIGLNIDRHAFIPVQQVLKQRRAVFQESYREIIKQFQAGRRASVQLRFWPTWPTKGRILAEFDLRGFQVAYREFSHCQSRTKVIP